MSEECWLALAGDMAHQVVGFVWRVEALLLDRSERRSHNLCHSVVFLLR